MKDIFFADDKPGAQAELDMKQFSDVSHPACGARSLEAAIENPPGVKSPLGQVHAGATIQL